MEVNKIIQGDCLSVLQTLPDQSVNCCITSPPYWGLRDYGVTGQLGLEKTPDEYVAHMVEVFREVRRVLRDDGTVWLNLGDSYASDTKGSGGPSDKQLSNAGSRYKMSQHLNHGLKQKDLVGIPWSVAKALQSPYYTGRIKSELDRIWLAATIDAEGSVCGFHHIRKDDGTLRTGIHVNITNSNRAMLDNAFRIWPTSREDHNAHGEGHFGHLDIWRWIAHDVDEKSALLQELYPYLICKKKQALLAWNFLELSKDAKRLGKSTEAESVKEKRSTIIHAISKLNHLEPADIPSWCKEPPTLYEQGWFLRQDLIWHKPNPMPESVTDRCTKAHEYIFLLSKKAKYYYDAESIREEIKPTTNGIASVRPSGDTKTRDREHWGIPHEGRGNVTRVYDEIKGANRRSVWTVTTKPFKEAHFATFPPDLIEPCAIAGCPENGVILDPFMGAGTTGVVAKQNYRNYIGIELNQKYIKIAEDRINGTIVNKRLGFKENNK